MINTNTVTTVFVSFGEALWKSAWQKVLLAHDSGGSRGWFP